MIPFLPLLRRMRHGLTLGVRTIVLSPAGEVLLVRHTYAPGWHFPGGGVDAGESAEDAARRELMEEAAMRTSGPLTLQGAYFNARYGGRDHVLCYRVADYSWDGPPRPNREIAEVAFFPLAGVPGDVSPGTGRRIAELRGEAPASPLW